MNITRQAKLFLLESFLDKDLCIQDGKVSSDYFSDNYLINDTIGGLLEEHNNEELKIAIRKQYDNFLYQYEVLEAKEYKQEMFQGDRDSWNDDILCKLLDNWLDTEILTVEGDSYRYMITYMFGIVADNV